MRISDWSSDVCSSDLFLILPAPPFHHEGDGDTRLNAEHIVPCAGEPRIGAHVAAEVDNVNIRICIHDIGSEPVEGPAVDEGAVGNECDNPVVAQPVRRPAVEAGVHVVDLRLLGCRALDIAALYRSEEPTSELQSLMRI